MFSLIDVNFTVDDGAEAQLQVDESQEIGLTVGSRFVNRLPDYTGPTSVTPSTSAQELATAETSVHSNITVNAIPPEYIVPTGTYNVSSSGTHNVKAYASASVPAGSATVANQSITANPTIQVSSAGKITATVSGSKVVAPSVSAGWVASGSNGVISVGGTNTKQLTTQAGATIAPSTSQQTAVAAGRYTTGAVIVDAMPVGTEGTPTASKGAVSNHAVDVTPSVTNSAGYIDGGTHTGTAVTVSASELVSGTKSIAANGTGIDVTDYASVDVAVPIPTPSMQSKSKSYTPTETAQSETVSADSGYDGLSSVDVSVAAVSSTYVGSGITRRDSTDLSDSGATVSVPAGYYETAASKAVASGSATVPSTINAGNGASISYGLTNITLSKSNVSITPTVTPGYVSSGTAGNATVYLSATADFQPETTWHPSTSDQNILAGKILQGVQHIKAVTMENLTAANIKDGVTVKIGDSTDDDCVTSVTGTYTGGSVTVNPLSVTTNGTYTAPTGTAYSPVTVSVSGGSVQFDTKTATASNYPVSLSFTGMKGEPKAFVVRLNAQVSSSGSTTYYYIVDVSAFGTTTHGNCFRIGSTRRIDNITSGYSWSYSGTTLTITSSAASRSASPGAFYSGSYELLYAY